MANDTLIFKRSGKVEKSYIICLEYKHIKEIKQDKEYLTIKIDEEMGKKLFDKC